MWDALRRLFGKKRPEPVKASEPARVTEPVKPPEPVRPPEPPEPAPWRSGMILQAVGDGDMAQYPGYSCKTTRLQWVSRETDEDGRPLSVRVPEPETRVMSMWDFTAAGRSYKAPHELAEHWYDKGGMDWCGDKYGHRVLYDAEMFPCFDSSDYLYEDRYYRWFFLWEDGKLTRVQYTDDQDTVVVTDDVLDLENKWWKKIQKLECFQ